MPRFKLTGKDGDAIGNYALVDAEDVERLKKYSWNAFKHGGTYYARTTIGDRGVMMHRYILNSPNGTCLDHINHNGLDNRKKNLRYVTVSQNQLNRRGLAIQNTTGHTGVCWRETEKLWIARAKLNGKSFHLGCFKNKKDAIRARRAFEKKYHKI